jgi:phosphoribosylanthranilate isomerase
MVRVKICGITNQKDAFAALDAGADALGFVFYNGSPRNIAREDAARIIEQLPPFIQTVGLFVNESIETINNIADLCGLDVIQLHGDETPQFCNSINRRVIKALRIKDISSLEPLESFNVAGMLLDAWSPSEQGGTGRTFNWDIAEIASQKKQIILAGGLSPDNVTEAIRKVRPYAVDVSSGVESSPGVKDHMLLRDFIRKAKESML